MSDDPNERFRDATDRLIADPPSFRLRELAKRLRVSLNTVNRARMMGGQQRTPPSGWERIVASVARAHADALVEKARDLHELADRLDAAPSD